MSNESDLRHSQEIEERKISQALVAAGLVDNSGVSDGLIFPIPSDARIKEIVASYDSRSWGTERVRCAICPQHQRHFRGFRVELDTGDQARIGIDCGEQRFGKDTWKIVSAEFNRRVEIETLRSRVEPAVSALQQIVPLLGEWHQRTNRFASWLNEFRRNVPELAARLSEIAKTREGRFEIEKAVKRHGVNREGRAVKFNAVDIKIIGQMPHPSIFLGDTPTRGLNGAKASFCEATRLFSGQINGLALASAFRAIQRARSYLTEADQAHSRALATLELGWLPSMCKWANQDHGLSAEYQSSGNGLVHNEDGSDQEFRWMKTVELGISNFSKILALWPNN